jgi:hypothetical protein
VTASGIACPGTCAYAYAAGASVTLTATAATGSTFVGWSGGGCSDTDVCAVAMSSDQAVTATFNTTGGGGGSGTPSVGQTGTSGTSASVTVGCSGAVGSCAVTVTLTVVETLKGGKVIAIIAKKPKTTKHTVVLGSVSVTVPAGHSTTVKISLNGARKQLLAKHHTLAAKLTLTQTGKNSAVSTKTITFKTKRVQLVLR